MKFLCCSLLMTVLALTLNAQTPAAKDSAIISDHVDLSKTQFVKVDIESDFPGGAAGWRRFLQNNLVYPKKAERKKIEGTVVVQFIVDKDGTISNISAISGPELLQEAATDVIKKSPNWTPATQNGRKVKSYKKQPITFKLQ